MVAGSTDTGSGGSSPRSSPSRPAASSPPSARSSRPARSCATQEEALDALAADELLLDALGPTLAQAYLAVRRSEWAAYSAGDERFEQQGHFEKY
jgi:glutamine synthetase